MDTPTNFKVLFSFMLLLVGIASAQLSSTFYSTSCPKALSTIKSAVDSAVSSEARMGASLLRLHFHDCFVNASHFSLYSSSPPLYIVLFSFIFCVHVHDHNTSALMTIYVRVVYVTSSNKRWHNQIKEHSMLIFGCNLYTIARFPR